MPLSACCLKDASSKKVISTVKSWEPRKPANSWRRNGRRAAGWRQPDPARRPGKGDDRPFLNDRPLYVVYSLAVQKDGCNPLCRVIGRSLRKSFRRQIVVACTFVSQCLLDHARKEEKRSFLHSYKIPHPRVTIIAPPSSSLMISPIPAITGTPASRNARSN